MKIPDYHFLLKAVQSRLYFTTSTIFYIEDEMHRSMQRNVVVMIAVLLGLQPKSNNLWFHLFEPLELMNTFIPGFLVRYLWL